MSETRTSGARAASEVDAPDEAFEDTAPPEDTEAPLAIPDEEPDEGPAVPATVVLGQGDVEVDCPGCGLRLVGDSPRPTAAWFCPRCDYPLFWVSEPPAESPASGRARRRLPGTGGRVVLGAQTCWHCAEHNEPGVTECIRCAATLPKPVPPQVPVIREAVPVPMPVAVKLVTWPYVAAAACSSGAIGMALVAWVSGG